MFAGWAACTAQGKDFELILPIKMENRHPVGGPFGHELLPFVIIAELWQPEVARLEIFFTNFCFFWKTTPYGIIFKILFWKFKWQHRSTLLCWNVVKFVRREIGETVHYLRHKKIKFRLPLKLSLLLVSYPKSARASPQHLAYTVPNFIQIGSLSAEL